MKDKGEKIDFEKKNLIDSFYEKRELAELEKKLRINSDEKDELDEILFKQKGKMFGNNKRKDSL